MTGQRMLAGDYFRTIATIRGDKTIQHQTRGNKFKGNEITPNKIPANKTRVNKIKVDQIRVIIIKVDKIRANKIRMDKSLVNKIKLNRTRVNKITAYPAIGNKFPVVEVPNKNRMATLMLLFYTQLAIGLKKPIPPLTCPEEPPPLSPTYHSWALSTSPGSSPELPRPADAGPRGSARQDSKERSRCWSQLS